MQLKIVNFIHFLVVSCILLRVTSAYPGGCYECEEEVWEEVPCDQIPENSTTIEPPPYIITTTAKPYTTTMPTTTTTATTTSTTSTTSTTTTTTPAPLETTTPGNEAYKKCYCECKAGCKEFCRKVVVRPEIKDQIIQISEISEPVPQGRLESIHYHRRKLIPSPEYSIPQDYSNAYGISSSVAIPKPQPEISTIYSSLPYYRNAVVPPNSYRHSGTSSYNGNIISPDITYTNKHQTYYYSSPPSELYDLPTDFQSLYSNAVRELDTESMTSFAPSPNSIPNTPDYGVPCQSIGPFSSPVPVNNAGLFNNYFDSQPYYRTYSQAPDYSVSYR